MPAPSRTRLGPGPFVYHFVRLGLKLFVSAYIRVRVEGVDGLPPAGGYVVCFNHPSWLDPVMIGACWPDRRRRLFVFGPREMDMSTGVRNRLITWTGRAVPFRPDGSDTRSVARRAAAVLRGGDALAVAGEGRLSDHEGSILPIQPGVAHFATLARVPIVPLAVVGTRWVHFGSTVTLRFGEPVDPAAYGRGRAAIEAMASEVGARLTVLLDGVQDSARPGRFGAWLSELFNDRPWETDPG